MHFVFDLLVSVTAGVILHYIRYSNKNKIPTFYYYIENPTKNSLFFWDFIL